MSKIVSLFAPPGGAKEQASGSSGKKSLKTGALTGEEPVSSEGAVLRKPLRKKKNSFMDHLLFHGENLSPPALPAPASPVSQPVQKGTIGKASRSSVLTEDSGGDLKKANPSPLPASSFVLPVHAISGKGRKSESQPTEDPVSETLPSRPVALTLPGTGKQSNAGPAEPMVGGTVSRDPLLRSSSAVLPQHSEPPSEASFATLPLAGRKSSFDRSREKSKDLLQDDGQKVTSAQPHSKAAIFEGEHLKPQDSVFRESSEGDPFREKEITRESSILPERKTVASTPGEASVPDQGAGEKGTFRDFSGDSGKPSESKNTQSTPSAASALTAVPLSAPDTLQIAGSDRPAIDQGEMLSKVVNSARHGGGEISLRVHPPALGPIRIQVHVDPRTREVEVRLFARDESIGDLLRSKSQELKGALSREGFTMHQFHVDGGSGDLPIATSSQTPSSGFASGGDSSSASSQGFSQGSGTFLSQGSGGGSLTFNQGGDGGSRERSEMTGPVSGMPVSEEPSFQPADRGALADLSGFHRVV